jgi:hypothetical protein
MTTKQLDGEGVTCSARSVQKWCRSGGDARELLRLSLPPEARNTLLAAPWPHRATVPLCRQRPRPLSLQPVLPSRTIVSCDLALCHLPVLDGGHRRQLGNELPRHWVSDGEQRLWSAVVRHAHATRKGN